MKWVRHNEDTRLPDWLAGSINSVCPECGSPIENGYNDVGDCTRRRCSNYRCKRMIAARIGKMCELLKYTGVKEGIGYRLAKQYDMKSHFEAVPLLFENSKPRVTLPMFLRCACIYGIDSEFDTICRNCNSLSDVFLKYMGKYRELLLEYKEELESAEQYFEFITPRTSDSKYKTVLTGTIVITGSIPGLADREMFVGMVNAIYKGLVGFSYSKTKRKTGLYCCIAQDKSTGTGKIGAALEGGAPVLTVSEFFNKVDKDLIESGYGGCIMEIRGERSK